MGLISTTSAILLSPTQRNKQRSADAVERLENFFFFSGDLENKGAQVLIDLDVSNCGRDAVQFEHVYVEETTSFQVEVMRQMG